MTLQRYLDWWGLSAPQLLAETGTSQVYIVTSEGARVVLKLLKPIGVKDEGSGALALRHVDGHGAVRLLRYDESAHLLEYADGEDLIALVQRGEDEQATAIIGDVLSQLHSVLDAPLPSELTPLKVWFRDLFRRAEAERDQGTASLFVRAANLADSLFAEPREVRVLHGDIHHANIRRHAERGWLAFDPKGLVGERTYDAANTICNPVDMPAFVEDESRILRTAEILSQKLGIDRSRILAFTFVYVCLSASWRLYDGVQPVHELKMAALVEPLIL